MPRTDVIVAGLGALGGAAARALARRGLRVVGLDRYKPPHAWGSSHGGSRIIRRVYAEGSEFVPLVDPAFAAWRQLEEESGNRLLLPAGGLFLGRRDGKLVADAAACARACGLEHELLAAVDLARRFPLMRPPAEMVAVFDPRAGVLRLEACLEALLASAAAAGAELRFGQTVEGWGSLGDGVEVTTGEGTLRARHLVLATGPWLAAPGLAEALEVERQVQHWFEPTGERLGPAELPPFVWELAPGRTWYALPDLGEGLKAALHHGGETTSAEEVRREVASQEVEEVRGLLERFLPAAAGRCLASAVCLYTNTPDGRFLAGPLPGRPRIWILGGGSGHAFKFAPVLGELVAEGLTDGSIPPPLSPFLPARLLGG